jgi:virulence-associated protein VapD
MSLCAQSKYPAPRFIAMEITKDTKVSAILETYGDIADVMEIFGVRRVGGYSVRKYITKALTVETAAKVHRVPLDEFLDTLHAAIAAMPEEKTT